MNKIVEYKTTIPHVVVIVEGGQTKGMPIQAGESIGFDLEKVYCKNANGNWQVCLTTKNTFLKWLDHGTIKEKFHPETKLSPSLSKKIAAYKQQKVYPVEGVLARPTPVPDPSPVV